MKFIISAISMKLFMNKSFDLKVNEITEEEFQALAYDAFSYIRHEDIAKITGFAHNDDLFSARIGDVLLLVNKTKGGLKFHCIQIMENETPLVREEELYAEEEVY